MLGLPWVEGVSIEDRPDGLFVHAVEVDRGIPSCECGGTVYKHGIRTISVRDASIRRRPTVLRLKRRRYRCQACGTILTHWIPGLRADRDMTDRLRTQIAEDAIGRPFADAGGLNGVDEATVRRIFAEHAKQRLEGYSFSLPTVLGMDEKVINGRPRFMLGDMDRRTLLDMLPDRKAANLADYFNAFTQIERQKVEVVTQDMYWPYKELNERFFRRATVVVDKFHVLRYANEAVERVRKAIQGELDDAGRIAMKRNNRLLSARPERLDDEGRHRLNGILRLHPALGTAVWLKEAFFDLYECQTPTEAEAHYLAWIDLIPVEMRSPFRPILSFMRNTRWRRLILNYFERPYTNAYAESLNSLVDQMNRAGRGYRFETLRAKALLRYGPFRHKSAKEMSFLSFIRYHGIDLSTFESDLREGRF